MRADQLNSFTTIKLWLDAFLPMPFTLSSELQHRYDICLTHHSTAIEGNSLSQSETQIVIEKGITIGGKSVGEHLEVIGHKEALDFVRTLAEEGQTIGEREIREIHSLVMKGQGHGDSGAYRTLDVMAAGTEFRYPSWLAVPEKMGAFAQTLSGEIAEHPIAHASRAHLDFVTIRPFRDGNGRVGRLLLNLLLLRHGYPIAVIPVERRSAYIDSLVAAQTGEDGSQLLELVMDAVEVSLRDTLAACLSTLGAKLSDPDLLPVIQEWLAS